MQRIERYGVMALALLLVTILAVALWGERADAFGPGAADERVARADDATPQQASPQRARQTPPAQPVSQPVSEPRGRRLGDRSNRGPALSGAGGRPAALPVVDEAPRPPRGRGANPPATQQANSDRSEPERTSMRVAQASLADRDQPQRIRRSVNSSETPRATPAADRRPPRSSGERASTDGDFHRVRKGETLSGIAQARLGSSKRWRELADLNGISDPRKIAVGQKLALPGGSAGSSPAPRATSDGSRYTIRPGDTLSEIAQAQLGRSSRWKEIVELNPKVDPARLMVGTKLRMPGGALAALDGRELARAQ